MSPLQQSSTRNLLLKALAPDDFARLQPHLELTYTELRQPLIVPNEPVKQLFFPESGYASLATQGSRGVKVEAGIGRARWAPRRKLRDYAALLRPLAFG